MLVIIRKYEFEALPDVGYAGLQCYLMMGYNVQILVLNV